MLQRFNISFVIFPYSLAFFTIKPLILTGCSFFFVRVKINPEKIVAGQCPVLEPVTVSLSVKRNLAYGWFKEIPAVDVSCQLESIKVSPISAMYRERYYFKMK